MYDVTFGEDGEFEGEIVRIWVEKFKVNDISIKKTYIV